MKQGKGLLVIQYFILWLHFDFLLDLVIKGLGEMKTALLILIGIDLFIFVLYRLLKKEREVKLESIRFFSWEFWVVIAVWIGTEILFFAIG